MADNSKDQSINNSNPPKQQVEPAKTDPPPNKTAPARPDQKTVRNFDGAEYGDFDGAEYGDKDNRANFGVAEW